MTADLPITRLSFPPEEYRALTVRDAMPEALRKVLLGLLENMLLQESAVRLGTDIEGVHQMRVATRHIRSLYKVFGHLMDNSYQGEIPAHLKQTARVLGAVRDLDVFMMSTQSYIDSKGGDERTALLALYADLESQHQIARRELMEWLDSEVYLQFVFGFFDVLQVNATTAHLTESGSEQSPVSYEVRHILPALIFEQFRAVRQYEVLMPTQDIPTLHKLRIHAKRLRYSLNGFEDVLGRQADNVITQVKELQSYLGQINDASVAVARLDALRQQNPAHNHPAIDAYHSECVARCEHYVAGFPAIWTKFNDQALRRSLALALASI